MKQTILAKCKPSNLATIKATATDVGLSITSYGKAPESDNITFAVTGNHNVVKMFLMLLVATKAAWVTKDKAVQTPSKV